MSVKDDLQAAIDKETARLGRLVADFNIQKAAIEKKLIELKQAQELITPQLERVIEKLNLVIGVK